MTEREKKDIRDLSDANLIEYFGTYYMRAELIRHSYNIERMQYARCEILNRLGA